MYDKFFFNCSVHYKIHNSEKPYKSIPCIILMSCCSLEISLLKCIFYKFFTSCWNCRDKRKFIMKENALINSYPLFTLKIFILESNHTNSKKVTNCHVFYHGMNSVSHPFIAYVFYCCHVVFFFCNVGCKVIGSHVTYS